MADRLENLKQIEQLERETTQLRLEYWINDEVFTLRWWFLVGILIIPWILWIKLSNKCNIFETLFFGTTTIITSASLDAIGEDLSFWGYPVEFTPVGHNAFPFNFGIVPVAYMLLHQYGLTWKSFCVGLLFLSAIFAFIGEPMMQFFGVYFLFKWKFAYSFIYYLANGFLIRAIINAAKKTPTRQN